MLFQYFHLQGFGEGRLSVCGSLERECHKEIISGRIIEMLLEVPFSKFLIYWSLLKTENLSDYFLINILLAPGQASKYDLNHLYSGRIEKKFILAKSCARTSPTVCVICLPKF